MLLNEEVIVELKPQRFRIGMRLKLYSKHRANIVHVSFINDSIERLLALIDLAHRPVSRNGERLGFVQQSSILLVTP